MSNQNLRIVSLIPSATEILAALGLTDAIVGRSHECDYPPEIQSRPVCTQARLNSNAPSAEIHNDVNELLQSALSIYQIKTDVLEQLQPTHILTQDSVTSVLSASKMLRTPLPHSPTANRKLFPCIPVS